MMMGNHTLVSQNYFQVYDSLYTLERRELPNYKADSLITLSNELGDIASIAKIAHQQAINRWYHDDFTSLIRYGKMEVEALEEIALLDTNYTKAVHNLGKYYFKNNEFEKAIPYHQKVIQRGDHPLKTAQSYTEMGRCYNKLGLMYKSIEYLELGLAKLEKLKDFKKVVNQSINLGITLRAIGNKESLDKRMTILSTADSLSKIYPVSSRNRYNLINALGNQYIFKRYYNFKKARNYYSQYLNLSIENNDSLNAATAFNNLINLYNIEVEDSAFYFAQEGLKFKPNKGTKAKLYENISQYYLLKGDYSNALENIQISLEINLELSLPISSSLSPYQLNKATFKDHTLYCLKKKSEILLSLYIKEGKTSHLENVLNTSLAAAQLIDLIQDNTEGDSKLFWRKEASTAYLQGAKAAHLMGDSEKVFFFMEKNKALALSDAIANNTAFSGLPKNITDRKTQLNTAILLLEEKLEMRNEKDSTRLWKEMLFDSKRAYEKFEKGVKSDYPAYFQNHIQVKSIPLSVAQASLNENEVLISFIWNELNEEEVILGLVSNSTEARTFEIPSNNEFKNLLKAYKQSISKPFATNKDQVNFKQIAVNLYNQLFPSQEVRDMVAGKNITFIPDGDLQNIPFETLIPDESTGKYLIASSDINYLYSVSFLTYNNQVTKKARKNFIGYAPVDFKGDELTRLSNSETELISINEIVNGSATLKEAATKAHFLENSSRYKIIHLATHASEENDPWISFTDEKLELSELFNHQLNANLVVLSACNTSLGEVAKGEGVLSLARGFFYAGTKSVVSSLWNVNDKSTEFIMTQFYKNLESGQTKSEALNNAKRDYLATHSLSEQSPYYWSSFILIGDSEMVSFSNNTIWYIATILILLILILLIFRKKLFR